jgi:hypothetical protein
MVSCSSILGTPRREHDRRLLSAITYRGLSLRRDRLPNHLIHPRENRRRNLDAERLHRLEVEDQFELRRLLDRQVGGLGASQDTVHVGRRLPVFVSKGVGKGHESPGLGEFPVLGKDGLCLSG